MMSFQDLIEYLQTAENWRNKMYYSEEEARKIVIEAGHRLLETGLIARTWGNISARISKEEFIITPSGLAYDTLTEEKLVKVKCEDLSYEGNVKPSSEKGVHAIGYILRPEVSFIIHTHQFYASAVAVGLNGAPSAPAAEYGLPGTDKLKDNVMVAITKNPTKNAFLMQKHGAVILGKDYEDAFKIAEDLEAECKEIFESVVKEKDFIGACAKKSRHLGSYIDDYAQILGTNVDLRKSVDEICSGEDSEAERMILEKNCAAALYAKATKAKPLGLVDANLQRVVYLTKYSKLKDKA